MDQLIKLVRTYRLTGGVAERVRLAEAICRQIAPDLRFFVFGFVPPSDADDVLQNTVKAIIGGLRKFEGDSPKQFWAWCYRIARNKICDLFREKTADRVQYVPTEELHRLLDKSARDVVPVGLLEIAKDEARNQWEIEQQNERDRVEHERDAPKIEPPHHQPNEPGIEP